MGDRAVLAGSVVAFCFGVFVGYKLKGWRIDWLKRRRERLAGKLLETQREIELLSKST